MKRIVLVLLVVFFVLRPVFAIDFWTISALHQSIEKGEVSCEQVIRSYIDRIKRYNLSGSREQSFNAFTEINKTAFDQAKQLDDVYFQTKKLAGSLHCVPVVIKDNIDTYDATTSSGSLALLGNQPNRDAFLVEQLRKEGAVILGKTSMDELGAGMFGKSTRSGRIGNAYDVQANSGGSSGGSAVSVALHFSMIGVGTDNSGSVRIPAAFNGVYGLRPSTGLISQTGLFPAGNLDGTAGPMAETVTDLARVLDVIARHDERDPKTKNIPRVSTYTAFLNENGLKGKRIGIVRSVGNINLFKNMPKEVLAQFNKSIEKMRESGAIVMDDVRLDHFYNGREGNMSGMREDVNAYLASFPAVRKNAVDLCESNRVRAYGNPKQCVKFFKSMPPKSGKKFHETVLMFKKNKTLVESFMQKNHLDALLLPISTTGVATYDPMRVNTWRAPVASNSGLPAITINLGYINGMPFGVELIAEQFQEGKLIEMAYAHEQLSERMEAKMPEENHTFLNWDVSSYDNYLTKMGYDAFRASSDKMKKSD